MATDLNARVFSQRPVPQKRRTAATMIAAPDCARVFGGILLSVVRLHTQPHVPVCKLPKMSSPTVARRVPSLAAHGHGTVQQFSRMCYPSQNQHLQICIKTNDFNHL